MLKNENSDDSDCGGDRFQLANWPKGKLNGEVKSINVEIQN